MRFFVLFAFFIICSSNGLHAQFRATDSVRLTQSLFTKYNGQESWGSDLQLYILLGTTLTKQAISTNGFQSNLVYNVDDNNTDKYKLGMLGGINVEGPLMKKCKYSILLTLNQYNSGTYYKQTQTLKPLFGAYSNFKATDRFLTLQLSTLYKLTLLEKSKHGLHFVLGPSIEYKIEKATNLYSKNTQYNPIYIFGLVGGEYSFTNKVKAFIHYKQNLQSLTPSPINIQMNTMNMGLMFNVNEIF
jgi:hypothetical protein